MDRDQVKDLLKQATSDSKETTHKMVGDDNVRDEIPTQNATGRIQRIRGDLTEALIG